jgi:hypothetical protein
MPLDLRSPPDAPTSPALQPPVTTLAPPAAQTLVVHDAPRAERPVEVAAPSVGDLVAIGVVAFAVHVALFAAARLLTGWTLTTFANLHDGESYLRIAGDMIDPETIVAHFDRRVFIGYPSVIALLGLVGVPLTAAALLASWLASAGAAVLSAQLFADRRVGWALALFPPSWLLFSTLAMSEATLLLLVAAGVYCVVRRDALILGGLALGYAGLVRPVACFAVLGLLAAFAYRREWRKGLVVGGLAAAVVASGFLVLRLWRGDALEGVKIYAKSKHSFDGELFTWPFESLITTPLASPVSPWKIAYVWLVVAFVLGGCVLIARKARRLRGSPAGDLALVGAVWLIANTLFVLCMGNKYGFHYFDRHIIVALPPLLWAYSAWLPRHAAAWAVGGAVSIGLGLSGLLASVV